MTGRGAQLRGLVGAITLAMIGPPAHLAFGQTARELHFRKEYVPVESLGEQARGLLPIRRDDFERRLAAANSSADNIVSPDSPRVDEAVLQARVSAGRLVEGMATLTIVADVKGPRPLPLGPCNLMIEAARWEQEPARPVVLGSDHGGNRYIVVERGGRVALNWSMLAESTAGSESTFVLRLPPALNRRIELAAPDRAQLRVDGGVVRLSEHLPARAGERQWIVDLSSQSELRLTVTDSSSAVAIEPVVIAQEFSTYSLLPAALDVESVFTLDVMALPLTKLNLLVDSRLELTSVRLADRALTWHSEPARTASEPVRVTCDLPEPVAGVQQRIEVEATSAAGLAVGSNLPRVVLESATLQEAKLTVQAPEWMRLSARAVGKAVKSQASTPGTEGSDKFEFLVYGSDGGVEVAAELIPLPLIERSGTQITIEANQVVGQLKTDLRSRGGEFYAVEAYVSRQWVVDAVETEPADMLAERSLSARGSGPQRLQLKLAQPVTEQRPLNLTIRAHYRRPANLQLAGPSGFQLASFPAAGQRQRLINLHTTDPQAELSLSGDETLIRLDENRLATSDRALFEHPTTGVLFDLGSASERLRATLRPAVPRYRAEITLAAHVNADGIYQEALIECQPEGAALGSIAIKMTDAPEGRVQWKLVGNEARELTAVIEPGGGGEAMHRLLLPRATSGPITIQGSWRSETEAPLNLVWLPDAIQHTAVVEIFSAIGPFDLAATGVRPLPLPPVDEKSGQRPVARYLFETGQRSQIRLVPATDKTRSAGAWIERLQLSTRFAGEGSAENFVSLAIHNAGGAIVKLRLPEQVTELRLIEKVGETIVRRGANGEFGIPLLSHESSPIVNFRYTWASDVPSGWPMAQVAVPMPHVNVPVLRRVWNLALPPEYAPYSIDRLAMERPDSTHGGVAASATPAEVPSFVGPLSRWGRLVAGPGLSLVGDDGRRAPERMNDSAFRGWQVYSRELVEGESPALTVFQPRTFAAWSLCVFVFLAAVVFRLQRSPGLFIVLAGMCLAAAVLTTAPFSWLLAAAGSGAVVGLSFCFLRPGQAKVPVPPKQASALSAGGAAALVMLSTATLGDQVLAAEPSDAVPAARAVFPIDNEQRQAGEYIYLEPRLYEAIHRAAGEHEQSPTWLIERTAYEISSLPRRPGNGHILNEMKAVFNFHTFKSDITVELPLLKKQLSLLPGKTRLDGGSTALRWSADGRLLLLNVPASGRHQLELVFAVSALHEDNWAKVELSVPRSPISTLGVSSEGDFEVLGGVMASKQANPNERRFQLPDSGRLAFQWTLPNSEAAETKAHLQQLNCWKLRPASVVLETQFRLRRTSASLDRVTIVADPRLRMVPNLQSGPIKQVDADPLEPNRLNVQFAEPADEVTFRLAWLWSGSSGMGKLILPRVRVEDVSGVRDWAAISLDPSLHLSNPPNDLPQIPIQDFVDAWSGEVLRPTVAFDHGTTARRTAFEVEPVSYQPSSEETVEWSISSSAARVTGTIHLTGVPPNCFEHEIVAPANLKVTELTLHQSDQAAALRWQQQANGNLRISVLEAIEPTQTIAFRGELGLERGATQFRLPVIKAATANATASQVRVYRQSDVQLELQPGQGWQQEESASLDQPRRDSGRLVAALVRTAGVSPAEPIITRHPNRPKVSGKLLTTVQQVDGDWRSTLTLDLTATEGVLDEYRLLVPEAFQDDVEIEPVMDHRFESATTEGHLLLIVEPAKPVSGRAVVHIRSPLPFHAGGIEVPHVQLLGAEKIEHLVLLAPEPDEPTVDWEISNLTPVKAEGRDEPQATTSPPAGQLFRVSGPQFRAMGRYRPQQTRSAVILHSDIKTLLLDAQRVLTTATFLISPVGTAGLPIQLPPEARLIRVQIDGVAVACSPVGVRTWLVQPVSDVLPFELTVVFEAWGRAGSERDRTLRLMAPLLRGLMPPAALWTVSTSPGVGRLRMIADESLNQGVIECGPAEAEVLRLEAHAEALEAVQAARGASVPKRAVGEAFSRWEQLALGADRALKERGPASTLALELDERRQTALERISLVRQRLFQAEILSEDSQRLAASAETPESHEESVIVIVPGGSLRVQIVDSPATRESTSSRRLLAGLIAVGAMLLGRGMHSSRVTDWLSSHPKLLLTAGGFGWWLLAPLAWMGWFAIAAAIGITIRDRWTGQR